VWNVEKIVAMVFFKVLSKKKGRSTSKEKERKMKRQVMVQPRKRVAAKI